MVFRHGLFAVLLIGLSSRGMAAGDVPGCAPVARQLPARPASAPGGSEFARRVASLGERERDDEIRRELLAGNLPAFLHSAAPVRLRGQRADGRPVGITLCVLPDYLSIGSDDDYLLMPMSLDAAVAVGQRFGFTLPTRRIVDAIHAQAPARLSPLPLQAGERMRSIDYYVRHNSLIRAQREWLGMAASTLIAGHKKDLVASNRLWQVPGRVAIYGWHRAPGAPIQPLSIVHGAHYADYSHGVRLVATTVLVDDRPMSIFEVLADATLAPVLSDEGPLRPLGQLRVSAAGD